jgi:hypothetical protein
MWSKSEFVSVLNGSSVKLTLIICADGTKLNLVTLPILLHSLAPDSYGIYEEFSVVFMSFQIYNFQQHGPEADVFYPVTTPSVKQWLFKPTSLKQKVDSHTHTHTHTTHTPHTHPTHTHTTHTHTHHTRTRTHTYTHHTHTHTHHTPHTHIHTHTHTTHTRTPTHTYTHTVESQVTVTNICALQ